MQKKYRPDRARVFILIIFTIGLFLLAGIFLPRLKEKIIPIRIGYSSLTATHCHIGEVFRRTGFLKRHHLDAVLTSFEHGDEQGQAVRDGRIDVTFSCEVPAILLVQSNPHMKIVATVGALGRVAVLVPEESGIYKLSDMRGKRIAVPVGSNAHKDLIYWMKEVGLSANIDIQIIDVPLERIEGALADKTADAVVIWDPWVEKMIRGAGVRIIKERLLRSVVIVSQRHVDIYHQSATRYLAALKEALSWAAAHKDEVDLWVAKKSGLDLSIIKKVSGLNKNLNHPSAIDDEDIFLKAEDIEVLRDSALFLKQSKAIPESFNLADSINAIF